MQRAERTRRQRPKGKDNDKLHALHATEVECTGKAKAHEPYEFGVKMGVAVTQKQGLMWRALLHQRPVGRPSSSSRAPSCA